MDLTELKQKLEIINSLHEAGHAVVTILVGTQLLQVQLHAPNWDDDFGYCMRGQAPDDMSELLIRFAGEGAELVHLNDKCWSFLFRSSGRGDWKDASSYIERIGGDRRAVIKQAKVAAINLLKENWAWVVAVADELRKQRYLTGEQVCALEP